MIPKASVESVVLGVFALRKERVHSFIPALGAFPPLCYGLCAPKIHQEGAGNTLAAKAVNPRGLSLWEAVR